MVNNTAHSLMIILYSFVEQAKTHSAQISRHTFQNLLSKIHDTDVGIRWISKSLKTLEDTGYIRRERRYIHSDTPLRFEIPSVFSFTSKGMQYLVSMGVKELCHP